MAVKAFVAPKKKKINRKQLDSMVADYIKKFKTFEIPIASEDGKDASVEFKSFINPVELGVFLRQIREAAIMKDDSGYYVDPATLKLGVHLFILQTQSSMPDLTGTNKDGETELDLDAIGVYGEYFYQASEEYYQLFEKLYDIAEDFALAKVYEQNKLMESAVKAFDFNSLFTEPEVLDMVKDVVKAAPKE